MEKSQTKICEIIGDNIKVGDVIRDQHGSVWEVLEKIKDDYHDKYKCKIIKS